MTRAEPRLTPRNPHWYEDLPERNASFDMETQNKQIQPDLPNALNHIDDIYLEVSRASKLNRGIGLAITPLLFICVYLFVFVVYSFVLVNVVSVACFLYLIALFIRTDIAIPFDQPVRFNREKKKYFFTNTSIVLSKFLGIGAPKSKPSIGTISRPR